MTNVAGLVLVADSEWLEYHAEHSRGEDVIFYRGVGGKVAALSEGGVIFCARKGETPRRIHAHGFFRGNVIRHHDEIWSRYKNQLGADTKRQWRKQAAVVLKNSEKRNGEICAIRLAQFQPLTISIDPSEIGIEVKPGMQKGQKLIRAEVDALIEAMSVAIIAHEQESPILSDSWLEEDLEVAIEASKKTSVAARKRRLAQAPVFPKRVRVLTVYYRRNPDVIVEVLRRADEKCERCGKRAPFLRAKDGSPYLEVHHKVCLADGGKDTVDNAEALCPNCHREVHFGLKKC